MWSVPALRVLRVPWVLRVLRVPRVLRALWVLRVLRVRQALWASSVPVSYTHLFLSTRVTFPNTLT